MSQLDEMIGYMGEGMALAKGWFEANAELVQKFANFRTGYMGLVDEETGALELYDGPVRLIDRDGNRLEQFPGHKYLDYVREHVEDWSYLKFPYYKKMGWPDGVYRVAPLGRLNVADARCGFTAKPAKNIGLAGPMHQQMGNMGQNGISGSMPEAVID